MEITDVRVKLINVESDRLKAVCTVTFDKSFVVRDVKVVEGTNGLFVAMPSRKLSLSCQACGTKNHLRARFCNDCGKKIPARQEEHVDTEGRGKLHRDIAHPITASFRAEIQEAVIQAFEDVAGTVEVPEYDYAEEEVYDEEEEQQPRAVHDEPAPAERPRNAYGDMIAGLRGSRAPSGPSPKERETPRDGRRREERPAPKQERTDRGPRRGGNGRGRGGRRNERREECPSESVAVREPEVESAPKVKEREPDVKEELREPSVIFGEDKPAPPTFRKHEEKVEESPAQLDEESVENEEDDDAPFGVGL